MKNLLLLSTLFIFTCSVFAQDKPTTDTIHEYKNYASFTAKLGFARIWESGNGPLYGFSIGFDGLYGIKLNKGYLETGLCYLEFDANRNYNGNTATITNEYLQIPLKLKRYRTFYEDQSKQLKLQGTLGYGLYANTLLTQRTEGTGVNSSTTNLGWNYGLTFQYGLKYTMANRLNIESGLHFQEDLSKMNKNGVQRKTDYIVGFYLTAIMQ